MRGKTLTICSIGLVLAVLCGGLNYARRTRAQNSQQQQRDKGAGARRTGGNGAKCGDEQRLALVIGNAAYADAALTNPVRDARAMAQVLGELCFDVTLLTDKPLREMDDAVRDFGRKLQKRGGVGLFYFSGHGVQVSALNYGFYMGKYEVTQAQYRAVMGANPSKFQDCDNCPVESVSWNDAQEFIKKLNARNDGYIYRLPSEAEWEYSCRAGTTTEFAFGDSLSSNQANFDGNYPYGGAAKGMYREKTVPVGSFQPNAFGLYDMHGNVWEWVADIYNERGYAGLPTDGSANISIGDSDFQILRGGSWSNYGNRLRSAQRSLDLPHEHFGVAPVNGGGGVGFRVVASARI